MTKHLGSLRKHIQLEKNTNIEIQQNPGLISCVPTNIKFEGSSLKNDFRNTKNAYVTWSAIMRIFNEAW